MFTARQQIKYEKDRDPAFPGEIKKFPGCENLDKCIQCGTCSGSCPLSIYMDLTPRRVIELTRSGFRDDVLQSFTIWLCASCYACTVQCPKAIGITDVMYALKQKAIQEKVYPKKFPIPVLAQEFFNMVRQNGRITESLLVIKIFTKVLLSKAFGMRMLGFHLLRTGRFSLKIERMKHRADLKALLDFGRKPGEAR